MECRPLEPQQTELESFMDVALLGSRVHGGEFYRTKGSGLTINGSVESFVDRKLSDEEDMVEEVVCDRSRDQKKKNHQQRIWSAVLLWKLEVSSPRRYGAGFSLGLLAHRERFHQTGKTVPSTVWTLWPVRGAQYTVTGK